MLKQCLWEGSPPRSDAAADDVQFSTCARSLIVCAAAH